MIQHFISRYTPKRTESRVSKRGLNTPVHSSIIHNSQEVEEVKCPLMGDDKLWSIHAVEYYSASKRKEILTHVTTWTNLDIMLNETSQSYRTNLV